MLLTGIGCASPRHQLYNTLLSSIVISYLFHLTSRSSLCVFEAHSNRHASASATSATSQRLATIRPALAYLIVVAMASSTANARPIKRKSGNVEHDPTYLPGRHLKRAKSENVSQIKRYLIGCAHLIYVKSDSRGRDDEEHLIPLSTPLKKAYAPSSDLPQKDMVTLYFDDIDRTVVSQSKSKSHVFAAPDWSIMEPYLFPWIHVNSTISHVILTRNHIKHVAFRVWEYLAGQGRVVIKYGEGSGRENVPLGDVRGWWWETDGDLPRNYDAWFNEYDGSLPGDCSFIKLAYDV